MSNERIIEDAETLCGHCGLNLQAPHDGPLCLTCLERAADHKYECKCTLCEMFWEMMPPEDD